MTGSRVCSVHLVSAVAVLTVTVSLADQVIGLHRCFTGVALLRRCRRFQIMRRSKSSLFLLNTRGLRLTKLIVSCRPTWSSLELQSLASLVLQVLSAQSCDK